MITEDYVSFQTAKLLKEKGFPQDYNIYHSHVYNEEDYEDEYEVQRMVVQTCFVKAGTLSSYPAGVPEPKCYCPTLQMAMKWLRKVHHITIGITFSLNIITYEIQKDEEFITAIGSSRSYEDMAEEAIKYCLEKLI